MIINFLRKKTRFMLNCIMNIVVGGIFLTSCVAMETRIDIPEIERVQPEAIVAPEAIVEEIEEPKVEEVPYTLAFATNLQETLATASIDEALLLFDDIPEEYANDEDLSYLHASLLVSAGVYEEASSLLQELQSSNPDDTDVQFLQAIILKEQGNARESKKVIQDILSKDPTNVAANVEMANTYMYAKNFRLANKHFVEGLRADPEDPAALFGHALTSWYLEDDEVAKNALNKLIEVEPENSLAWAYLGKLEADRGKFEEAIVYMKKAIEYEEDYSSHWLDLGSYYRNANKREEAEEAWSRAIELDPEYFLGYAYRGGVRDEMAKYDGALSDYLNVVKYNPEYYFAYESIGMLYWKEENWVDARNAFLLALDASPRNTSYSLLISATYLKEGKRAENQEFLLDAMRTIDRESLDYLMLRLYYDGVGDSAVLYKVVDEESITTRGRMLFYMALYYELTGLQELANKYYIEVADIQGPMFFEYRFCEWAVEDMKKNNQY